MPGEVVPVRFSRSFGDSSGAILEIPPEGRRQDMELLLGKEKDMDTVPPLPPRYRLRDLFMGDYAFNDDGER